MLGIGQSALVGFGLSAVCGGALLFGIAESAVAAPQSAQNSTRQVAPNQATSRRTPTSDPGQAQSAVAEPPRFQPPATAQPIPTASADQTARANQTARSVETAHFEARHPVQTNAGGQQRQAASYASQSNIYQPPQRTSHIIPPTNTLRWRTSTKIEPVREPATTANPFRQGTQDQSQFEAVQVQYTPQGGGNGLNPIEDPFGDRQRVPQQPTLPQGRSIVSSPSQQPITQGDIETPVQEVASPTETPSATGSTSSTELLWQRNTKPAASTPSSSIPATQPVPSRNSSYYQEPTRQRRGTTSLQARELLMGDTIQDINLNVSPWYDAQGKSYPEELAKRQAFANSQSTRSWTNREGEELAFGTMTAVENRTVFIDLGDGQAEYILINDLSDADRSYVYDAWMYPMETLVVAEAMPEREWIAQTFTWKASALCHKSLFYEDVQLERYGHSAGPILQPVKSTAHFFLNLAFVPYNSAIHPVTECNYALGYYRPGDCAPWLANPIPLSARGVFRQALATTALAFAVP